MAKLHPEQCQLRSRKRLNTERIELPPNGKCRGELDDDVAAIVRTEELEAVTEADAAAEAATAVTAVALYECATHQEAASDDAFRGLSCLEMAATWDEGPLRYWSTQKEFSQAREHFIGIICSGDTWRVGETH